jgi:hypothetical protein
MMHTSLFEIEHYVIALLMLQSALQCDCIGGSRTFNTALLPRRSALRLPFRRSGGVLPKHKRRLFSPRVDRHQRIQLAYGLFCTSMAFTDAGCRFFAHQPQPWVHPAFFLTTLTISLGLGRRVA